MKKIKIIFALSIATSALAGCGNKEPTTPTDWMFNEENGDNYTFIDSELLQTEDEKVKIIRISRAELLDTVIDDDDFYVFDYGKIAIIEDSSKYFSYQDYKSASVNTIKKEYNESEFTLDIYFEGNDEDVYGAVFNKDATFNGNFVFTLPEMNALGNTNEINVDQFETELLESPNPKADDSGYIDLVSHFGQMISYIPKEGENIFIIDDGILLALVGIILTIGTWIWTATNNSDFKNWSYFNSINERLNQIDKKLTGISTMLVSSFSAILDQLDVISIDNYTNKIGEFKNDYLFKIDNIYRFIADETAYLFKQLVSNQDSVYVEIPYDLASGDKYHARSILSRVSGQPEFTVTGNVNFNESKTYLREHNIVDSKFAELFRKDIDSSIASGAMSYPSEKLGKEALASDIFSKICESQLSKSLSEQSKRSQLEGYRNTLVNYTKQLYSTNIEIVNKYVNRCKLSYNFGAEAQKSLRNNLASLMFQLDRNAALCQIICRLSGNNVGELDLTDSYLAARSCIKNAYDSVKSIPSNYCFRDGKNWETKFFQFSDSVAGGYYGDGVRSSFNHSLETKLIKPYPDARFGQTVDYDRNANPWVNSITLRRMLARFESQKGSQAIGNITLLQYLQSIPGLFNPDSNRMLYPYAVEYGPKNIHRIMGDFSTRAADSNGDKGKPLQVSAKGDDPYNPYFSFRENTKYLEGPYRTSSQYWTNGTFYTCDMVDAESGEFKAQQDFIMYADYVEDHGYWRHYESYALSGTWSYYNPWSQQTYITTNFFGLGIEVK